MYYSAVPLLIGCALLLQSAADTAAVTKASDRDKTVLRRRWNRNLGAVTVSHSETAIIFELIKGFLKRDLSTGYFPCRKRQ